MIEREEVHRRGLAVRAGDADDVERVGRVAVERGGDGAIATRASLDDDLRHVDGKRALDEQRDRAALDRLGGEVVAVDEAPAHAARTARRDRQRASRTRPT